MTLLEKAMEEHKNYLEELGFSVVYDASRMPDSCSANIDSIRFVGTITHWPETYYEVQFNDCSTGDVTVLENMQFEDLDKLSDYIKEIIETHLS